MTGIRDIQVAVTPDEERYVPKGISQVINIGQRKMDCGTIVEILLKLKLYNMLEDTRIKSYFASITSNSYSFYELFSRSAQLESGFQSLVNVIDIGIIGVNSDMEIYVYNKKAEQILGKSLEYFLGKHVNDVASFLPFSECFSTMKKISDRLIQLKRAPLNVNIVPMIRNRDIIGAIAMFQYFNEEEERQHKFRIQLLNKGNKAKYTFDDIIGTSPMITKARDIAKKMAKTRSAILITGESGTGKELFAHAIHNASERSQGPFIAINCAALPENLLESELFGYVDGAFTGAKRGGKLGLFEFAHTGTFFLDEVEGMSPLLQIKLLRVLQEREVMRIGDNRLISVDVRVVAATNEKLERLVEAGKFREDLYYRLNTLPVNLPPLRERREDIMPLAETFREELGGNYILSEPVKEVLIHHSWRGNIRELHNYVEYFTYLDKAVIEMDDLPPGFYNSRNQGAVLQKEYGSAGAEEPFSEESRFLLRKLAEAKGKGITAGRDYLRQEAEREQMELSEYEIRKLLGQLQEDGYVKVSKGRGGTYITDRGMEKL